MFLYVIFTAVTGSPGFTMMVSNKVMRGSIDAEEMFPKTSADAKLVRFAFGVVNR